MKPTPSRFIAALLAGVLFFGLAGSARADGPFDTEQAAELSAARGLHHAGIAVSILGVAAEAATIGLWIHWLGEGCFGESCRGDPRPADSNAVLNAAFATAIMAPVLLGTGIPMWAVGAHREKKLQSGVSISAAGVVHF